MWLPSAPVPVPPLGAPVLLLALAACDETGLPADTGSPQEDTVPVDADMDGWTVADGDCDDGDAAIQPGAMETCDGADQDCDGEVDEDAADASTWYPDTDGDGFGDATAPVTTCEIPSGHVADGTDCDDDRPQVNTAAEEVCDNGLDDDCDGSAEPCGVTGTLDIRTADATFVGEDDYDEAGTSVAVADMDDDGIGDVIVGAPGGDWIYIVHGPVSGTRDLSNADAILSLSTTWGKVGHSMAAGDIDGDGVDDLLVGAPHIDDGGANDVGGAFIVLGPVSGSMDLSTLEDLLVGGDEWEHAGSSVAVGDVDGDEFADMLVGAPGSDCCDADPGKAYVLDWPVHGPMDLRASGAMLLGEDQSGMAGYSVAAGDVDGDGIGDVLVGAPKQLAGGWAGAAYAVFGPVDGVLSLSLADAKFVGEDYGDAAGTSITAGDVDGDGLEDLVIGAPSQDTGASSAGMAYVVRGPVSGTMDLSAADARLSGEEASDQAGWSLAVGDVDGDGVGDLLVGAPDDIRDTPAVGAAYVVHGPMAGTLDLSTADAILVGQDGESRAGYSIAAGDVDGQGVMDVLIGVSSLPTGGPDTGGAYLFYGGGF